ncbi:MAG: SDR family oxidoreductase [Cyclobacteriaceae bacterium]|nr:SDR family oxidoreductase [Cyclobacteriaceae bacterium]
MEGKICLVTGANAGIGLYTCLGLAQKGAEIVMCARNGAQVKEAQEMIISKTGNPRIHTMIADLSSMKEVKSLSQEFLKRFDRLDVLINNAGLFLSDYQETVDGFETQWAVNYLAPYVLTRRLLGVLKQTGSSRVINVSSNGHLRGSMDFNDLNGRNGNKGSKGYDGLKAYSQSKLGNVLFTKELAKRLAGTGVTCNALHPGVVRTSIGNRNNSSWIAWFWNLGKPFMLSVQKGARTSIYLASSPDVSHISGAYFILSKPATSSENSNDPQLATKLWTVSEELTSGFLENGK